MQSLQNTVTVGKRNYFTGYIILLHKLPVVAIWFIQSNNNEGAITLIKFVQKMLHTAVQVFKL